MLMLSADDKGLGARIQGLGDEGMRFLALYCRKQSIREKIYVGGNTCNGNKGYLWNVPVRLRNRRHH